MPRNFVGADLSRPKGGAGVSPRERAPSLPQGVINHAPTKLRENARACHLLLYRIDLTQGNMLWLGHKQGDDAGFVYNPYLPIYTFFYTLVYIFKERCVYGTQCSKYVSVFSGVAGAVARGG